MVKSCLKHCYTLFLLGLMAVVALAPTVGVFAADAVTGASKSATMGIYINGNRVVYSTLTGGPYIDDKGRTQVPLRATLEAFGAKVNWEESTQTALVTKGDIVVKAKIGEAAIYKNGTKIPNDTAATIKDDRTYLPIRAVFSAFGAYVNYNPRARAVEAYTNPDKNPVVAMEMASGKRILVMLYPKIAPITVKNFTDLVGKKFYDGLTFHRIISGFMIQGGDPIGNGTGGPGYSIKGEFEANGVKNTLSHVPGVISMARSSKPDSAGSQFFIVHGDATFLDGDYAAFGRVVEGFDVVNDIASVEKDANDLPVKPIVIKTIKLLP